MNFLKTCLAVVLGAVIGALTVARVRPQPVKAQSGTAYVDYVQASTSGSTVKIRGSRLVGVSCVASNCYILSE